MGAKKNFVLDTNVILHDYKCIENFQENDIYLPIVVLEELDKFKKGNEQINYNAREFVRELDQLTSNDLFLKGAPLGPGKGTLYIVTGDKYQEKIAMSFPEKTPDHRILSCTLTIAEKENQQLVIEMQRVVAKARVNFINQTGAEQQITDIRLVKVGAANTYLFPTSYDMNYTPNDAGSVDLALGDVTVSAPMDATASTALGYFYESTAPEGGYALQATWNGKQKTFPLTGMDGGNGLSRILRNAFINITLTLKQNDWKLEYEVLDWDDAPEINIDFTDVLSYTSYGWQRNTYLDLLPNNTVWMNPDEEAVLSFAIEAPSGTLWRAALEGDVNAFQFVGASSGSAYTEDSNTPVAQSIRVKVTDPESNERHEVTLRVYADIGGKTYELDLTDPDTQKEPGGVINRFTLLQSR